MAQRELDILVRAKGALQAAKDIGKVDSATSNLGRNVGRIGRAAAVGIGAAVGGAAIVIGKGVSAGLDSLAQLESAESQVTGALNQMGLAGQITATQVAGWASQIEKDVGSAFDDKDITSATATLLRFGKVTPSNLQPAMVVMTDLAAKTGSVDSAASLLAKALADPTKAAGKLARAGVVLTKAQQDQIKAMVKAGDTAGAQKVLLDALAKTTTGAAAATQGPYARSLSVLKDVTEDAERALAEGFLPVIEEVRDLLSKELAKPSTLNNIREFGKGLAGGLKGLIDIAKGLPWSSIGDALKIGGAGAKAVLDAFTSMPPWVQTAIATGWGLNKLTGGAVSGIVGTLASGLIKGVLGMNAGVVNINAGVVNGGAGVPGAGGAPGAAAPAAGGLGLVAGGLALIGVAGVELLIADQIGKGLRMAVTGTEGPLQRDHVVATLGPVEVGLFQSQDQKLHDIALSSMTLRGVFTQATKDASANAIAEAKTQGGMDRDAIETSRIAIASKTGAVAQKTDALRTTFVDKGDAIVRAVRSSRPIVNLSVRVSGDTVRVTKNYTSGSNIGKPGHAHTGGQQEFG